VSQQAGPSCELRARYLERGFSKTEAAVIIARKPSRVAWAIYTKQQLHNEQRVLNQPCETGKVDPASQTPITYAAANPVDKQIADAVATLAGTIRFLDNHNATYPNRGASAQQHRLDNQA